MVKSLMADIREVRKQSRVLGWKGREQAGIETKIKSVSPYDRGTFYYDRSRLPVAEHVEPPSGTLISQFQCPSSILTSKRSLCGIGSFCL